MEYRFTSQNYEQEVAKSNIPVMIDFYADWCGPCRAMGPVVTRLAEKYAGRVKVGKVNSDEQRELSQAFRVMSIPYFVFMKGGKVVDTHVGGASQAVLEQKLDALLG